MLWYENNSMAYDGRWRQKGELLRACLTRFIQVNAVRIPKKSAEVMEVSSCEDDYQ
jgi:hypothetical protein